jgi:competence ComEA-like helix-hairpin-helix protein
MRWALLAASLIPILLAADGDDLPPGPGRDVFVKVCGDCHTIEQVTAHHYPKKFWTGVVDDMVSRGAQGSDDEIEAVIGYLARNFGKPVNVNTAAAREIETALSLSAAQSEALVQYRSDKGPFKTMGDLTKVPGLNKELLEEQRKNILF